MSERQNMATAPRDTPIKAMIPGYGDALIIWTGGLLNSADEECGGWMFMGEGEPPESWTDGIGWERNADLEPSVQPVQWKPA